MIVALSVLRVTSPPLKTGKPSVTAPCKAPAPLAPRSRLMPPRPVSSLSGPPPAMATASMWSFSRPLRLVDKWVCSLALISTVMLFCSTKAKPSLSSWCACSSVMWTGVWLALLPTSSSSSLMPPAANPFEASCSWLWCAALKAPPELKAPSKLLPETLLLTSKLTSVMPALWSAVASVWSPLAFRWAESASSVCSSVTKRTSPPEKCGKSGLLAMLCKSGACPAASRLIVVMPAPVTSFSMPLPTPLIATASMWSFSRPLRLVDKWVWPAVSNVTLSRTS